jgi:hypothetical protein
MHTVLGLLGLLAFVLGILALSSAATALVVKISPTPAGRKAAAAAKSSES